MSDNQKTSTNHVPTQFSKKKIETKGINNKVFKKPATDRSVPSIPNTKLSQKWRNPVLEKRFQYLQQLAKKGWRIELETIDQIDNGYWHFDPVTKLPYPDQKTNRFGDISPSYLYNLRLSTKTRYFCRRITSII